MARRKNFEKQRKGGERTASTQITDAHTSHTGPQKITACFMSNAIEC